MARTTAEKMKLLQKMSTAEQTELVKIGLLRMRAVANVESAKKRAEGLNLGPGGNPVGLLRSELARINAFRQEVVSTVDKAAKLGSAAPLLVEAIKDAREWVERDAGGCKHLEELIELMKDLFPEPAARDFNMPEGEA